MMTSIFLASLALPFALQAAQTAPLPPEYPEAAPVASFDELPLEQAAAPRCAIAFAVVTRWQNMGDPRGSEYPDIEENGGREFFIQALAQLMEQRNMNQEQIINLASREVTAILDTDDGAKVEAMMPACLLLKDASGL